MLYTANRQEMTSLGLPIRRSHVAEGELCWLVKVGARVLSVEAYCSMCPFYFLPLQRPLQNDAGLPQNKSNRDTLQYITEGRAVEIPGPPISWQAGAKGHCHHASEPLSVMAQRPDMVRDEAEDQGRSHTLPSCATLFSSLFLEQGIPGALWPPLSFFPWLPCGFPDLRRSLKILPSQINFHTQPRDSKLLKHRTLFKDVAQLPRHGVRACSWTSRPHIEAHCLSKAGWEVRTFEHFSEHLREETIDVLYLRCFKFWFFFSVLGW